MLEMFLYGVGVMYTPGPVNITGLYLGLTNKFTRSFGFFYGVGIAMLTLFLIYGYLGEALIKDSYLIYISLFGSAYILFLAFKVFRSIVRIEEKSMEVLSFKDGFFMQFLNPKATLATLPIATIHFHTNNITGVNILYISIILSLIVIGAPSSYAVIGQFLNKKIKSDKFFRAINIGMSFVLFYVAIDIFIEHVVNPMLLQ